MAKKDDELDVEQEQNLDLEAEKKVSKEENSSDSEGTGSKIISALIVLLIILIWLGVFIFAVKLDFMNFGSEVLTPVLRDVPLVNKILPDTEQSGGEEDGDGKYNFSSMDEAIERIKELEMQLDSQSSSSGVDSNYIKELEAEVNRLKKFEKQQEEFAKKKKEFDEEVVFAENAPDITEYQKYYEQIDPDNAQEIYRQVVEQAQYDQKVTDQAERYANMEPASAAQILDVMTSADLDLVCAILASMDTDKSALILQEMDSNVAAKITKRMLAKD